VALDPPGELPEPHVESRAPLRDDREEVGALVALRSGVTRFPAQHQELLQAIANQAALALRNAEHIERLGCENLVARSRALDEGALIAEARARAPAATSTPPRLHPRPTAATGDRARPWPGGRARRMRLRARGRRAGRSGSRALRPAPLPAGAPAGDLGARDPAPARGSPSA
jgi:hypothetical protein